MWAAVRLFRATLLMTRIFASYLLMVGLSRVLRAERAAGYVRERWRRVHRANARRLYRGIVALRGVFIKMGQVLSIMGTFLPRAYSEELETLQDQVPPHPFDEVEKTFRLSIGRLPRDVFRAFEPVPLAAASLGQVHRATLLSGEDVAVKILYPDIATVIRIDLRVLRWATRLYALFVPVRALERVIDQLQELLARETDYVNEGQCMERMAAGFASDPDVLFPTVHWELTTREVLVMSYMHGIKISRKEELGAAGLDPDAVARKLVEAFYKQLFVDGFFHADPHPGNFLVQKGERGQPRIVILDFGAASETRKPLIDGMLDILRGTVTRDDAAVIRGVETMGFVAADGNRELLHRTIRLYFEKLLALDISDLSRIKPDVALKLVDPGVKLAELRDLMKSVVYPDGWFYVERAAIIIFGLCAQLAPRLNTLQVGFPYIMRLMAERQAASSPS
jgi:predicted unusual protein kinase regulating ubiquinone biosynthesis (AarF/ABC1/UbiB family)